MSSVKKPQFNLTNLQLALAIFTKKSPDDSDVIESLIGVTRYSPRANGNFESSRELINAIHQANIFPEGSQLPEQIADAFDWVIRRPVRTYSPQDLLKKLESKFESFYLDLIQHLENNKDKFPLIGNNQDSYYLPQKLITYVKLCLVSPSLDDIRHRCSQYGISFDQFNELEKHFKIFSGEDIIENEARKNLLKFYLKSTIKEQIDFDFNVECFGHLVDPDNNSAPYLDLMSGSHPIRHISSFMSPAHGRQIILTDKSKAVKQLYEIVDELTDGEFFKRVKLLNEDIFNLQVHLKPNSIGTIRLSNVVSFMPRELIYGEINEFDNKASKLVSNLMGLLKPGGKIVFCLRHLDNSNSQDISIDNLLNPGSVHQFINFKPNSPNHVFFKILYDKAKQLGYEIKVGHTDLEGNFIENKSGFSEGYNYRATELVLIKPRA
ncbi:MAG: hypothetical protein RLZZ361_727 [Cyanobacteriota bacterium]